MREYTVYFDCFGKKMKTKVLAKSDADAKQQVIDKIVFVKVESEKSAFNSLVDMMDDTINMLNGNDKRP
jgi:hypothetical protein